MATVVAGGAAVFVFMADVTYTGAGGGLPVKSRFHNVESLVKSIITRNLSWKSIGNEPLTKS